MSKKKYCLGCGVLLQDENITQEGYVTSLENNICQRCFRMKNYGEYQVVAKSNEEYIEILKSVGKTKDLVLHIVDLVNLDKDIHNIREYLPNKMILVLNKRDALPKSVKDEKIIDYIKSLDVDYEDIVIISANKNYNLDLLMKKIVISGSSKLQEELITWKKYFEQKGYEVIDYPKQVSKENLKDIYKSFYESLEKTDILFLMNEERKGIKGYIGPSSMAEVIYAIMLNQIHNKKIEIYILNMPSKEVSCYDEIKLFLETGWIKIYK